ncbi:RibD family protein [Nocardioides pocheonensis]|uniref:RibD family protein n=1 Tax=Nocardioides pocheonensis TaxID=661485 RepID=A0A3N0GQM3_9ACTN|nr:RibD family protein [Nocardioides pocheonensis]RNM14773.1 RibD family protein [Nocardioides pocheonensis]
MPDLPYTVLSCCMSLDGYLDDSSADRLVLSSPADLDRVDGLRARSDAILVGAATVRADDPRLVVREPERRDERLRAGLPPSPMKVTLTALAKLDPEAAFFTAGDAERLVYCTSDTAAAAASALDGLATVVDGGSPMPMRWVSHDLGRRGVRRLLVEGGAAVLSQFLADDLADELQLAVAPFLVGDSSARRFLTDGRYPWTAHRRARLVETRVLDDVVLLRYALSDRFVGEG